MVLVTRPLSQVGNLQSLLEDSDLEMGDTSSEEPVFAPPRHAVANSALFSAPGMSSSAVTIEIANQKKK